MDLTKYWHERRFGVVERLASIREGRLDRARVLADKSYLMVGKLLLEDFIKLIMVDEIQLAERVLDTAEFYLRTAIERDDLTNYMVGQEELGRATRLKELTIVRWLRDRDLDLDSFREAVGMKQNWNEMIFSLEEWRETGSLSEWMVEKLVLSEFEGASQVYEMHYSRDGPGRRSRRRPEDTLYVVAQHLSRPDEATRRDAEIALDTFHKKITNWGAPGFREADMSHQERLLYAYIRGKHFKGEEDPIRLIKRMKFRE